LDCSANNLTALEVSNNTALEYLVCCDNNISILDVSCIPEILRVVNEGSESISTLNNHLVREFRIEESRIVCDQSTELIVQ
jgi:hypothetical protein